MPAIGWRYCGVRTWFQHAADESGLYSRLHKMSNCQNRCSPEIVRVQSNGSILSIFQVGLDLLQDLFRAQIIGIDVEIGVPASVP
jgi:hypothetical protein